MKRIGSILMACLMVIAMGCNALGGTKITEPAREKLTFKEIEQNVLDLLGEGYACSGNKNQLEWIEVVDDKEIFFTEVPTVTKEKVEESAKKLFQTVFVNNTFAEGELEIEVGDFDGAGFLVTINEMIGAMETGNTASITYNGDGTYYMGTFIHCENRQEVLQLAAGVRDCMTEADAIEKAEAAMKDFVEGKYPGVSYEYEKEEVRMRNFRGEVYYQVEYYIDSDQEGAAGLQGAACIVDVDVYKGEIKQIASSF